MADPKHDARQRESQRIIERVSQEAESGGRSMLDRATKRARDHVAAADVDRGDRIEYWGTRIGRILSIFLVIGLVAWLINFLMRGGLSQ